MTRAETAALVYWVGCAFIVAAAFFYFGWPAILFALGVSLVTFVLINA